MPQRLYGFNLGMDGSDRTPDGRDLGMVSLENNAFLLEELVKLNGSEHTKRKREAAVPHRAMGPRQHSLEAIESLNVPLKELDPTEFATFDERMQHLKRKENHRLCWGKSGIHGWGLFALRPIECGEMIIEYRGERIRCCVSDAREARYRAEKKDCYFFRISKEFVLDATRQGNIARLINHSPNFYARIVETNRIMFVAKEDMLVKG